ncbi:MULTISPECIES: S-layer homology domain-containing protein [unclassified Veillonella]|uniref:S-layer homology domain-containing protein n=1 Tax=unclassified Veillonella TaxID=2630086 RepID=UPI000F8C69B1|nr:MULTISPECIES: S-layer homology domain-containing protein [unclassified Veillonella]
MKKHLAVLAATAVLGVTSAFAANPFSDVTPQDWAYQAVAQLAAQGVVNGYPDGTFKGQNNITRYEMAQMVAKALVRQDRVDAEQNAIINRLANEFSAELNNLGVRVATLENKVGNFKFTGDARLRYTGKNDARDSKFDYRGRVKFEATVNDNTKAVVRLAGSKEFGAEGAPKAELDRVYVQHNFGKYATVAAGRQDLTVGNGLAFDGGTFEGVVATAGKDKLNASVAYGYLQSGTYGKLELDKATRAENSQVTVYQLNTMPTEKLAVKGFYADAHEKNVHNAYGASLDLKLGNKVWAGGEYVKTETQGANGEAWTAGLGYGNYNMAKQGTWSVKGQYYNIKKDAPVIDSALGLAKKGNKGVYATAKYAVAKNVGLAATATIDTKDQANKAQAESYRAELNYKF